MNIRYSKRFVKQLKKQPVPVQKTFMARLQIFAQNPYDGQLRRHALKGKLKGFYSIDVTGDVRAIYEIVDDEIYLYQMIGSHSQLYN